MKNKFITVFAVCLVFTTAFFITTPKANAFSLGDIINDIKGIFTTPNQNQNQNPSLTVTSNINLTLIGTPYNKTSF